MYLDWWGWLSPPNDPSGVIPVIEDFLQNFGGSRWLNTVTQYYGTNGACGNPTNLWGGEWFGSTNPLPGAANTSPCTHDSDCTSHICEPSTGKCYVPCARDADCASNKCNPASGKCYPTYGEFVTEVTNAVAHFNPVDDGIIIVELPPFIPNPGFQKHEAALRTGHPAIAFIEAAYTADATPYAEHEIAEAITDPRWNLESGKGWVDNCGCEMADVCEGVGDGTGGNLSVGESRVNHDVITLFSNFSGAGNCVYAYSNHKDYYFVDVSSGNLMHTTCPWCSYSFDNYGKPSATLTSTPGAVSWSNGRQDAFVYGSDGNVWQWRQGPGISPAWYNGFGHPTGTLKYAPDAFSWRPLHEDVVVVSQNTSGVKELWARRYDNGWNAWRNLGAPPVSAIASRPGTASWGPNRFDIFFLTTESPPHVRHAWSDSGTTVDGWDDWGYPPPDVTLVAGPDAASWGNQRVDVVALDTNGNVWQRGWDHTNFYGWSSWGHPSAGAFYYAPTAVGQGDGRLDIAASTFQGFPLYVRQAYRQIWNWSGYESTWDQNYDAQYEQGTYIDASSW